jgi:sirohydrochlorin cobaltochelatase
VTALILFSHGSLLCGAGEALEAHAQRLRQSGQWPIVAIGYLNYSDPPFLETVERVVEDGATSILVLPYFLVPGFFVTKSLPEVIAQAQAVHPDVRFTIAEPLGTDEILGDAVLQSALGAQSSDRWRDPLLRAASSCRPSPECPLYGTPACPKSPDRRMTEQ